MGRRRYRYRKRQDDGGDFADALGLAFKSPITGAVLVVLFLIAAAICYANPTAMFGMTRLFGGIALLAATVVALFTLAGSIARWGKRLMAAKTSSSSLARTGTSKATRVLPMDALKVSGAAPSSSGQSASMLTKGEMAFYDPLRDIVAGRFEIHVKPSLTDVLGCRDHPRFREIAAMHVDFLLCDRQTLQPLLAIELDDRSHSNAARMQADHWKTELLAERRIPLLRQQCQAAYDVLEVTRAIEQKICRK